MAVLVWDSPQRRVVFELRRRLLVVGRDPTSDLRIDDPTVSRRHALLERTAEGVRVIDLGSTAGTKINGARLTPELPSSLEFGDYVTFGRVVMTFHRVPPPLARAPARAGPWRWIAAGALGAATLAALAFVLFAQRPPPAPPPSASPVAAPAPPAAAPAVPEPPPEPPPPPRAEREPPPPPAREPERAAKGELPPALPAPLPDFPELLEIDGAFRPFRLDSLEGGRVVGLGADGRLYDVPRERVAALLDRAEIARRARAALPEEVAGRVERARWCLLRHCRDEAEALLRGVLAREPANAEARALLAELSR